MDSTDPLSKDVELIGRIPILSNLLEVITQTTGMGFAAIARVTKDRWVACGVRDEIRDSGKAVIIDNVTEDDCYREHHTPKTYGIQRYISVPIVLKDGSFFGTLCAIDPKPAQLNNPRIIGMFHLFADLISFHIATPSELKETETKLKNYSIQLRNYQEEVRQYQFISSHNLQEL